MVDIFTPAFRQGSAPRADRHGLRAPSFEAQVSEKADFVLCYCTQSHAQMMRRDKFTVNEMEFRMWSARQLISPREHRATMKGFSLSARCGGVAPASRLHQI
ncbi:MULTISPECIES: hypothetical protein [Bradyrhizobium]|uniref:hypothetical protein n=1 Tax=Bradyrhizobium TaxID=374 RepID=UPI0011AE54C5|nr:MULTISPECIES: hypothetical protein [Bradyrhizobium]